ncbi:MAG: type IV pilin-like G/H family protein, partial [Cyanobacteria bacterium P01_F01_bin.42]
FAVFFCSCTGGTSNSDNSPDPANSSESASKTQAPVASAPRQSTPAQSDKVKGGDQDGADNANAPATPDSPKLSDPSNAPSSAGDSVAQPKDSSPVEQPQPLPKLSEQDKELVSQVAKEVQDDVSVSTQNNGLITVNRVLVAQQAMWLLSGSFSTDFETLEPNLPPETDEYQFSIPQGDEARAVVKAIAKTDKLHSFTGAAVAVPTQVPQSALCRTKVPSKTPPQPPTIKDGQVSCANDGVLVDNVSAG